MDDYKPVFSDITLTVAAAPDRVQSHSVSATTSITEDPTIKSIFAASGARMQVSVATTQSAIDTITIKIPKSSNILEFPAKSILSANYVRAAGHFYDKNPHKFGGKQSLVTTDVRERRMFISERISYLPVRCLTNEYMDS